MKQTISLLNLGLALFFPIVTQAQTQLSSEEYSTAAVVRAPARQASTDIDATIHNPAGTAWLGEGLHMSVNGFGFWQTVSRTTGSSKTNDHIQKMLPSIQFVAKRGKLAVSLSIASEGGWGRWKSNSDTYLSGVTFGKAGSSAFDTYNELLYKEMSNLFLAAGLSGNTFDVGRLDDRFTVEATALDERLYNMTERLGVAYQFGDWSIYGGLKVNYVYSSSKHTLKPCIKRIGTGQSWGIDEYFKMLSTEIEQWSGETWENVDPELRNSYTERMKNFPEPGSFTSTIFPRMQGLGIAPVLGVDWKKGDWNIAAKYEFASHITTDGAHASFSQSAVLSAGASWQASQRFNLAVGSTIHFSNDNIYGMPSNNDNGNAEVSASVSCDYRLTDAVTLSIGQTYRRSNLLLITGVAQPLSCSDIWSGSTSLGTAIEMTKGLQLNVGCSFGHVNPTLNTTMTIDEEGPFQSKEQYKCPVTVAVGLNIQL